MARLYLARNEGRRGLKSVEETIRLRSEKSSQLYLGRVAQSTMATIGSGMDTCT